MTGRSTRSPRRCAAVLVLAFVLTPACRDADPELSSTGDTTAPAVDSAPAALTVEILDRAPHDRAAFTEGLLFDDDGRLYESLGLEGASSIREVDPATGDVVREQRLTDDQFGEGIAIGPDGFVQLTWNNGVARRWSVDALEDLGTYEYEGEGWGLTFDGDDFLQTDGSPDLIRRDADTFEETGRVEVTRDGVPVDELNELEWVDGVVYANVWHSDEIMRIDPDSGRVTGVIDASDLWTDTSRNAEMTLNGIAHRPGDPPDRLWLTGKNWPELFEVRVVSA